MAHGFGILRKRNYIVPGPKYAFFLMTRVCQFLEILWCPEYVNLQRFYGAPSMSIYRDFTVPRVCQFTDILWCPEYVNLQTFCRDFMVPRVCQFTEILWCQSMSIYSDFAEILRCPEYVNFDIIFWLARKEDVEEDKTIAHWNFLWFLWYS